MVAVVLAISSCKDYLDVNVDPNQSTSSRIDLQLSTAQVYTSIGMGQRMFPNLGIWCQYQTGGPGVALRDEDQNTMASSEGNELFRTMYRSASNLNFITKNYPDEKNYIAIAKILKAYNFQVCVDLFGNIPYLQALNGDITDGSVLHPAYDDAQTVVYPALETELNDAIRLIGEAATAGSTVPADDDLIYHGDMEKWDKFAHSLLLKIYLRSGKTGALEQDLAHYITSNDDAAYMSYPGGANGSNPFWNATKSTSLGNYYVATTTMVDYLITTQDPRLDYFYDKNKSGAHAPMKPGDVENAPPGASFSTPNGAQAANGALLFGPTAPVFLMSGWEGNLLLAEAGQKGLITTDAAAAYEAGVKASFAYLGITNGSDTTYLQGKGKFDAANPIKSIALQKWVCMNGTQPIESWIETRRFDNASNPIFTSAGGIFAPPTKNALGGNTFPSILAYPEIEESLNQKFPGQHPITDKVFWDN